MWLPWLSYRLAGKLAEKPRRVDAIAIASGERGERPEPHPARAVSTPGIELDAERR